MMLSMMELLDSQMKSEKTILIMQKKWMPKGEMKMIFRKLKLILMSLFPTKAKQNPLIQKKKR